MTLELSDNELYVLGKIVLDTKIDTEIRIKTHEQSLKYIPESDIAKKNLQNDLEKLNIIKNIENKIYSA